MTQDATLMRLPSMDQNSQVQNSRTSPLDEKLTLTTAEDDSQASSWKAPVAAAGTMMAAYLLRKQLFRKRTLWMFAGMGAAQAVRRWADAAGNAAIPLRGLVKAQATMTINRSPEDLYAMWADAELSSKWMERIVRVEHAGEHRSNWVMQLPGGAHLTWTSELIEREPGRKLAWRSTAGAVIAQAGQVLFEPAVNGRGTVVRVSQEFLLPGGKVSAALAGLIARTPGGFVRENLRHFKQYAETGEVPTTKGQPHGRRTAGAQVQRMALDENQQRVRDAQPAEFPERKSA